MVGNLSKDFNHSVDILLSNAYDKDRLFQYLRNYRENKETNDLMRGLKSIINCPERVPLYEAIRPLILPQDQVKYDRSCSRMQPARHRLIRLLKKSSDSFGFAIRGGMEYKTGFYVADVIPDSLAWKQGLRVGDQIIRMNGFAMDHLTHEEALNLLRNCHELIIKVRKIGLVPIKKESNDPLIWEYATDFNYSRSIPAVYSGRANSPIREGSGYPEPGYAEIFNIFLSLEGGLSLGCSISSKNTDVDPCVLVQSVKSDGLAELAGIKEGDEILSVNGLQLTGLSHSHAILALKCTPHLLLTLRRGTGFDYQHYCDNKSGPSYSRSNENNNSNFPASKSSPTPTSTAYLDGEPNFANQQPGRQFSIMETDEREIYTTAIIKEKQSRGLGFEVGEEPDNPASGRIMITRVYYHSPAMSAGVRVGDFLLTLDKIIVTKMMIPDVKQLIENIEFNTKKEVVDVTLAKAPPGTYEEEVNDMSPIFDLDAMLADMSGGSEDDDPRVTDPTAVNNLRLITFSTKL